MRRGARAAAFALVLLMAPGPAARAAAPAERIASGLAFPTNMAVAPDGRIFFTERDTGAIRIVEDGAVVPEPFATLGVIPGVSPSGETGLLGIALHPEFPEEPWVYATYSDPTDGINRLVRIRADGATGTAFEPLLDLAPATNAYHNGGDLAFGPDGMLYVSVGEAHEAARAQDPTDVGGKILRVAPDGGIPDDNPFGPASPVYSLGHRNSFGLCFDSETGYLWETENGPSSDDEINRIVPGGNYGWPEQLGSGGEPTYVDPSLVFHEVIVPTGCAFLGGSRMVFGDFHGELHLAAVQGAHVTAERVIERFGVGVTDVAPAGEDAVYVATADTIWRISVPAVPAVTRSPVTTAPPTTAPAGPTPLALVVAAIVVIAAAFALALRGRR